MNCDAKMRPFPNDTEITCGLPVDHPGDHTATLRNYAHPGSSTNITFQEGDRRTFHGDWPGACSPECPLPAGHPRDHG